MLARISKMCSAGQSDSGIRIDTNFETVVMTCESC